MHAYDTKDLERLFGLPASAVRALARAGNIHPVRRAGKLHYSFQDLVVLRTASALRAAKISQQKINKTLQELRSALPAGSALNKISLTALGNRIEQATPVTDQGNAEILQVIGRQTRQHLLVDLVFAESLLVPLQPEPPQPAPNVHRVVPALVFGA